MGQKPHVIVVGNEKGGTGKSTLCINIIAQLLHFGFRVGSIDVDYIQATLTRYLYNRSYKGSKIIPNILMPNHIVMNSSLSCDVLESQLEEKKNLDKIFFKFQNFDFIVIDTPGNDIFLSRLVHSYADTLITPLNDSFLDLDLLANIDNIKNVSYLEPVHYAEFVWEQKKERLIRDKISINWIVVRNRLSNILSRNKQDMAKVLSLFSERFGFSIASGFGERVIFKELFVYGLTLLDLEVISTFKDYKLSLSHLAAKEELRDLIRSIGLPMLKKKINETKYRNRERILSKCRMFF